MTEPSISKIPSRADCPKCQSSDHVRRKLHALPWGLGYDGTKAIDASTLQFVNGFWCDRCSTGFIPDELLSEFGLEKIRGI